MARIADVLVPSTRCTHERGQVEYLVRAGKKQNITWNLRPNNMSNMDNISLQLVAELVFMLQKTDVVRFYFLQHKNLLRAEVVIRATNNRNLQHNICCVTSSRKCCPYYLAFKQRRNGKTSVNIC